MDILDKFKKDREILLDRVKTLDQIIASINKYYSVIDPAVLHSEVMDMKINFTLDHSRSLFERVCDVFNYTQREMYSDEITEYFLDGYKDLKKEEVNKKISVILSDDQGGKFYNRRGQHGKHHKAKLWGLNSFKDEHGNVKEEHKYKSTQ